MSHASALRSGDLTAVTGDGGVERYAGVRGRASRQSAGPFGGGLSTSSTMTAVAAK